MGRPIIADKLSKAGWSWGCSSQIDATTGRVLFTADAYRKDGKRFTVIADDRLTAFLELERVMRESCASKMQDNSAQFSPCSLLRASPWEGQEIDCKMQSNYS
jgi:hypothetical protein